MNRTKRLLALLLCCVLAFSPLTAMARLYE